MSSSTGSTPDTSSIDAPAAATAGTTTSSNLTVLYIIIAVRYGLSVLREWRERNGNGTGALLGSDDLGLSMDDITALPTFTYRSRAPMTPSRCGGGGKSKGREAAAVECVVCLQELADGDVVRVLPACKHFFHGGCIDVWLRTRSSCPVCRAYPEPEAGARLGELSPPLPQLRRCGVSPERHPTSSASRILAEILARSPLRIGSSSSAASGTKEEVILSRSASPMPTATTSDYILSRSPSQAPLAHSASSETLEILVVRSKPPSPIRFGRQSTTRCVGVLERTDVIRSASASPAMSRAQW
ncbi:E3 ubiquitin-protein ligase ATL41 [Brachypodium distachyon]|uniref:E3 ubiquitin-protein ligase ATL41 n=1 Tax=Brachypodium distachyon TaxID=15368 RepID=UPI000234E45B|nr:E3 ubiquitin-protein ligase ATL41 [Brachypodium distachyon]|eukprot:XP_024315500.1 E3 ubiquitin-protein ligase ATL41 [Brachypodium distachyon]